MSDFKREERYRVFKLSDVADALTFDELMTLNKLSNKVAEHRHYDGKPPLECVCIESDWPIYEEAWALVEKFAESDNTNQGQHKAPQSSPASRGRNRP